MKSIVQRFQGVSSSSWRIQRHSVGVDSLAIVHTRRRNLSSLTDSAHILLHEIPKGSFAASHLESAQTMLETLVNKHVDLSMDPVSRSRLAWKLWERILEEPILDVHDNNDGTQKDGLRARITHPDFLHKLIDLWHRAVKTNAANVESAWTLYTEKLAKYNTGREEEVKKPNYDRGCLRHQSLGMILDAVSHQAEPAEAPLIAEKLLLESFAPINTVHMSTQLLQAWAQSGRREAGNKMMDILKFTMIEKNILPNQVSFGVVLRYWGRHGLIGPMEKTMKLMKLLGVEPSISNLEQILHGYAVDGQIDKAHKILRQMIVQEQTPPALSPFGNNDPEISSRQLIFEGAQTILLAIRNVVENTVLHQQRHEKALVIAEELYRWITHNPKFQNESDDVVKVSGTMMDIYSKLRKSSRVEEIYQAAMSSNHSAVNRQKLLNIFVKTQSMDRAMEILRKAMENPDRARPDQTTFNTVMDICANQYMTRATNRTVVENARQVFQWMQEFGLAPDLISYNTMLKCLAKSKAPGAAKLALETLKQMTDSIDNEVRPNIISFSLVTRALLEAKKDKHVTKITRRMEAAGIRPDMRFHAEILSYYSKNASPESAVKALKLLNKMRGSRNRPDGNFAEKPNIICFNLVLSALARGKPPEFAKHMCSLYEVIQRTKDLEPTIITYTVLLGALTKCDRQYLEKAESLLNFMVKSPIDIRPNHRHFTMLIRGYLRCNDFDSATRILMQVVQKCVDNPQLKEMVPEPEIIDQVAKGWLQARELVKATLLVEKIRELADAGLFPYRPRQKIYEKIRAGWSVSSRKDRDKYLELINSRITSSSESSEQSSSIDTMKSYTADPTSSNSSTPTPSSALAFEQNFVAADMSESQSTQAQSEQQSGEERAKELQAQVNELERNLNMHLSHVVPKIEKLKEELNALKQSTPQTLHHPSAAHQSEVQ